jgi:hypothetical protein
MRKILWAVCLLLLACLSGAAQDAPEVEVFGGYSWAGGNFHGWNSSVTANLSKSFGLVADFSGHYGSEVDGPIRVNQDAHSFHFGPRFSHRGERLTPFAYALFGLTRFHEQATISGQRLSHADTGFSSVLGGGLDVKVSKRFSIRAFQLDYFRPNFFGEAHNRGRLAFGVVLNLGKK